MSATMHSVTDGQTDIQTDDSVVPIASCTKNKDVSSQFL